MKKFFVFFLVILFIVAFCAANVNCIIEERAFYNFMSLFSFFVGMFAAFLSRDALNALEKWSLRWKYKNTENLEIRDGQVVAARVSGVVVIAASFGLLLLLVI